MIPRFVPVWCVALLMLDTCGLAAGAQTARGSQPGYTFQANSRVVLTDVTVTDKKGNPVHGLKASDFRILDDGQPQEITSFEEHSKKDVPFSPQGTTARGVYSNDYLEHPPRVLNILFLDLANISTADQMYLSNQLGKFIDALKPDEPIAVFARTGNVGILRQSFTADHVLLHEALRIVIPKPPLAGKERLNYYQPLHQIALYLDQIPGRKNVLWFCGGSTILLRSDASLLGGEWRDIYDELDIQRIAVYPIDVRGLSMKDDTVPEYGYMNQVAEATGGRAIYETDGIAKAAGQIVDDDGEYYTIAYSPRHLIYDNKWHKIHVTVPTANYQLSYRRGYFADGHNASGPRADERRKQLLAGGTIHEEPSISRKPIIFQATILPGAPGNSSPRPAGNKAQSKPQKDTLPFTVQLSMPLDAFEIKKIDGRWKVQCGAEIMVLSSNGVIVSHLSRQITFTLREEAARHPVGEELPLKEQVSLASGDVRLYLSVWDPGSRRMGTLEIPYHVDVPNKTNGMHASD